MSTRGKSDLSKTLAALHRLEKFTEDNSSNYDLYCAEGGDYLNTIIRGHMSTEAEKTKMTSILYMLKLGCNPNLLFTLSARPCTILKNLNFPDGAKWSFIEECYKAHKNKKGVPIPSRTNKRGDKVPDPTTQETFNLMMAILNDSNKTKNFEKRCCFIIEDLVHQFVDDERSFKNSEGCRSRPGMEFLRKLSNYTQPYVKTFTEKAMKDLLALEHLQQEICLVDMQTNPRPVISIPSEIILPSDMSRPPTRTTRQKRAIGAMKRGGLRALCVPFWRSPRPATRTDSQDTLCEMRRLLLLHEE